MYSFWIQASSSGYLLFWTLHRRNSIFYFILFIYLFIYLFVWRGCRCGWADGGGNNSSKQCQIELKFLPQVVLIVIQIPFKGKAQIFTKIFKILKVMSFGPNLTPICFLKMAKIETTHIIGISK